MQEALVVWAFLGGELLCVGDGGGYDAGILTLVSVSVLVIETRAMREWGQRRKSLLAPGNQWLARILPVLPTRLFTESDNNMRGALRVRGRPYLPLPGPGMFCPPEAKLPEV